MLLLLLLLLLFRAHESQQMCFCIPERIFIFDSIRMIHSTDSGCWNVADCFHFDFKKETEQTENIRTVWQVPSYLFSAEAVQPIASCKQRICLKWNVNALKWIADLTSQYTAITVCSCRMYKIQRFVRVITCWTFKDAHAVHCTHIYWTQENVFVSLLSPFRCVSASSVDSVLLLLLLVRSVCVRSFVLCQLRTNRWMFVYVFHFECVR